MNAVAWTITSILSLLLVLVVFAFIKVTRINFSTEDRLEALEQETKDGLYLLGVLLGRFEKKSKMETWSDEPVVREMVNDIKDARRVLQSITENVQETLEDLK